MTISSPLFLIPGTQTVTVASSSRVNVDIDALQDPQLPGGEEGRQLYFPLNGCGQPRRATIRTRAPKRPLHRNSCIWGILRGGWVSSACFQQHEGPMLSRACLHCLPNSSSSLRSDQTWENWLVLIRCTEAGEPTIYSKFTRGHYCAF